MENTGSLTENNILNQKTVALSKISNRTALTVLVHRFLRETFQRLFVLIHQSVHKVDM